MNETWLDKIEQYLNGNMSHEAKTHFESEIAGNRELSALLEEYKAIETEMRNAQKFSAGESALNGTLKKMNAIYFNDNAGESGRNIELTGAVKQDKNLQQSAVASAQLPAGSGGKIKHVNNWRTWLAAAAVLGIILSGVLWYFYNEPHNPQVVVKNSDGGTSGDRTTDTQTTRINTDTLLNTVNDTDAGVTRQDHQKPFGHSNIVGMNDVRRRQLFAANFKPDTLPANIPSSLEEPMADYKAVRHRDALLGFEAADPDNGTRGAEEDDELVLFYIHYYKAQSCLATNNTSKAITELRKAVAISPDNSSRSKVNWYLALAYLKSGSVNKAQPLLQELANNREATVYRQKAAMLLNDLRE